jgi:hypothetical protein
MMDLGFVRDVWSIWYVTVEDLVPGFTNVDFSIRYLSEHISLQSKYTCKCQSRTWLASGTKRWGTYLISGL